MLIMDKKLKTFGKMAPRPSVVAREHPLSHIPHEEMRKICIELGKKNEEVFQSLLTKTQQLFKSFEPLHLLSVIAAYGLTAWMTESGKTKSKEPFSFSLQHAEQAQAFALKIPQSDFSRKIANPDNVQEIFDSLVSLNESFSLQRLGDIENTNNEERTTLMLQEHIRLYTQNARNWGYYNTIMKIYTKMYTPLDHIFETHISISATNLIRIFKHIIEHVTKTTNQHWQQLHHVFKSKSISEVVKKYYKIFPNLKEPATDLINFLSKNCKGLREAKAFLMSHADLFLSDCFIFSVSSIASSLQIDENHINGFFSKLSLTFGDLAQENPEYFFLDNPIWAKPFIRVQDGSYFCMLPIIFTNFGFRIIEQLLKDAKAGVDCSDRRSEFLENEITSLFKTAFPQAKYIPNFVWDEYETDLLLKFESTLIIVEAKSGSISIPALRGAPKRTRQHIKELIIEPAKQSFRLEQKVLAAQSNPVENSSFIKQLPFDITDIKNILRLSVTLEDFAGIQANLSLLKDDLIDPAFVPIPTIMLADLIVIMDILQTPAEKIHYLLRRNELEHYQMKFYGSEIDILGLYIENGLNIAGVQDKEMGMLLMGMTEFIDEYYVALDNNIVRKKPKLKQTIWWHDILLRLETKRPQYWLDASIMLLNYPIDEQYKAERAFRKIKKYVQKNWRNPKHMNSVIITPHNNRQDALALVALKKRNWQHRLDLIKNIAGNVLEDTPHVKRCLALGVNIDSEDYPYSIGCMFFKKG